MEIFFWTIIFLLSLFFLVKGADWFLKSAEKIGLALGFSSFIVGVTIVALGTSLPELASSLAAALKDVTEIVVANAIGSNIANILLIVGISALLAHRLTVTKSLIDLDLPLLAISTVILLIVLWDKKVFFTEALLLLSTYIVYLLYTVLHQEEEESEELKEVLPKVKQPIRKKLAALSFKKRFRGKIKFLDILILLGGALALFLGAKYLIDSLIVLSQKLNLLPSVITISAVALGTSLPELIVSAKAALAKKSEIALGNIFGSNVFNALVVIGVPGLIKTISVDEKTFLVGIPVMALATLLFVISGISRRIHVWEGAFYLLFYLLFIGKLFSLF